MSPLSPYRAASEGFRLLRREPRAALAWAVLWLATFSAAAWVVATGKRVVITGPLGSSSPTDVLPRFGPFAALLTALFLLVWLTTAVATFRAVLRPGDRRWFYLRLGADEVRLGVMSVVALLVVFALGWAPGYLVFILASPIMRAVPTATRDIATVGALITVWIDIWLGVRLSLIAVETFAERRFHLTAYWPVTRGRFWYLLGCYFLLFLVFLTLTILFFAAAGVIYETAVTRIGAGDLLRRGSVLLLAGLLAGLTALFWTVSWTVFCACQAYAFRAIVGEGRDGVTLT
jgi:hypothetical protein